MRVLTAIQEMRNDHIVGIITFFIMKILIAFFIIKVIVEFSSYVDKALNILSLFFKF